MSRPPEFDEGERQGELPSRKQSLVIDTNQDNVFSRVIKRLTLDDVKALRALRPASPEQLEAIQRETPAEREAAAREIAHQAFKEVFPRPRRRRP